YWKSFTPINRRTIFSISRPIQALYIGIDQQHLDGWDRVDRSHSIMNSSPESSQYSGCGATNPDKKHRLILHWTLSVKFNWRQLTIERQLLKSGCLDFSFCENVALQRLGTA